MRRKNWKKSDGGGRKKMEKWILEIVKIKYNRKNKKDVPLCPPCLYLLCI